MSSKLAEPFLAQFSEMEGCSSCANDESRCDIVGEVVGHDDDGCVAMHVALKCDGPLRHKSGHHSGKVLTLHWPEGFRAAWERSAPTVFNLFGQHRLGLLRLAVKASCNLSHFLRRNTNLITYNESQRSASVSVRRRRASTAKDGQPKRIGRWSNV
jgi:hypothetical protein